MLNSNWDNQIYIIFSRQFYSAKKQSITAYRNGSIPCEQLEINTCYMLGLKFFDIWKSKNVNQLR